MEPEEKIEHKSIETPEEVKISSSSIVQPKHNNLLVILLLIMFIIIVAIGALFVTQSMQVTKTPNSNNPTSSESSSTSTQAPSDGLSKPVTTNIDNEVVILDSSMSSQSDTDFSSDGLSNSSLGI